MRLGGLSFIFAAVLGLSPLTAGTGAATDAVSLGFESFAEHCFSPHLTWAVLAQEEEAVANGVRFDFYDLMPFSANKATPVTGRPATGGTDRRCEVSFDSDAGTAAVAVAIDALSREGIRVEAPLPTTHADAALPGTTLLAARKLNPRRIAIVHTGTRTGANGIETFLMVERLMPGVGVSE